MCLWMSISSNAIIRAVWFDSIESCIYGHSKCVGSVYSRPKVQVVRMRSSMTFDSKIMAGSILFGSKAGFVLGAKKLTI